MSSIRITHVYNKRHKIVIAFFVIAILLLNIAPAIVFSANEVEAPHRTCVELRKDPLCAKDGEFNAYEVSEDGTELMKLDQYATCAEYKANPKMVPKYSEIVTISCAFYLFAEGIALVVLVILGMISGVKAIIRWTYENN